MRTAHYRSILMVEKRRLEQILRYNGTINPIEKCPDIVESAQTHIVEENGIIARAALEDKYSLVLGALDKIAIGRRGEYGICEDCSEEIGEKRLKALPHALYCLDCQKRYEQNHTSKRTTPAPAWPNDEDSDAAPDADGIVHAVLAEEDSTPAF